MYYTPNGQSGQSGQSGQPPFQYTMPPVQAVNGEAQLLRRRSSSVGWTIVITFVSVQILSTMLILYIRNMGLYSYANRNNNFSGIDPTAYYLMYGVYAMLSMVIPFLVLLKISKVPISEVIVFQSTKGMTAAYIAMGMAVCMFANIATNVLSSNLQSIGITPASPPSIYENTLSSALLYIAAVCVVPACVEEFAFRGVILGMLRKFGDGFAVITSAILFGMMHGNLVQIPFAFIVGLILGYLVVRTGSMLPAILLHFCNNLYSCILEILSSNLSEFSYTLVSYGSMILIFALGVIGMLYLLKKDRQLFSLSSVNSSLSFQEKMKGWLRSPGIIVAGILLVLESVISMVNA